MLTRSSSDHEHSSNVGTISAAMAVVGVVLATRTIVVKPRLVKRCEEIAVMKRSSKCKACHKRDH